MKQILFFAIVFMSCTSNAQNGIDYSIDSPITEKITNGDVATGVHIVQAKESLYSISSKYNLTVDELCEINNIHKNVPLHISQSLKIVAFYQKDSNSNAITPSKKPLIKETPKKVVKINQPLETSNATYHVIKFRETLYSISRQYGLTVNQLKAMNNLDSNLISLGQKLRVK